jgi:hypothetical protein
LKKLWVIVIAAVLALGACGGDDDDSGSEGDNPVINGTPTTTVVP